MVLQFFSSVYEQLISAFIAATENGYVPDFLLRPAIRYLLSLRAKEVPKTLEGQLDYMAKFVADLKTMPVAINTSDANEQHYEVPTEYYLLCLGKHLKYSSCLYNSPRDTLSEAEANMLGLYVQRAELVDGQDVLELGCGWGSMSLFMAAAFPNSRITAVSNSRTQREFIMGQAKERGITNLQVITANMVDFKPPGTYDRVVSIEMFEHMKNYAELLRRVSTWLKPAGKLFVHIFTHRSTPYHFETQSSADWMTKYFFAGGTMPSIDLLLHFQDHLALQRQWYVNGVHYSRTLEAWLRKQDEHRDEVMSVFGRAYKQEAWVWYNRWRMFYIACSELFRYNKGEEWGVTHYLFVKK
eukprot:CAMPEP_0202892108 /NCGR_PEP_ID=MMETSP1392-20130828/1933_1 /ASSEMBLY_ACC=CAM_ASM_000868 /TAXON_ID=225041 /ORGANISM="Chlamydomonas chlamydogama, Strain SAG 11-48b" /LENGTH=354 /DNA_ID=CAMNT_0049575989 /DNA_START=138 /DNA_END=1202 /DNA_ORIENTATION=+